jgi:hypothetical protein
VNFHGVLMTKDLALSIDDSGLKTSHGVHRQQLKGTCELVASKNLSDPFKLRTVQNLDPEPHPLMRLPYDVRYEILKNVVPAQNIRAFLVRESVGIQLPAIAYAGSTKLRRECLLVALNQCTMEIHSGPGNERLQAWLAKVDFAGVDTSCKTGFDAITSLRFPYFGFFPFGQPGITANNDVEVVLACKNLRKIRLTFSNLDVSWWDKEDGMRRAAAAIVENYQLEGILEAQKLEVLSVFAPNNAWTICGLRELFQWFEAEFEHRGRRVVLEFNKFDDYSMPSW